MSDREERPSLRWMREKILEISDFLTDDSNKSYTDYELIRKKYQKIINIKPIRVYASFMKFKSYGEPSFNTMKYSNGNRTLLQVCNRKDYEHSPKDIKVKIYRFEFDTILKLYKNTKELKLTIRKLNL
jgi:hypothetical protein